MGVGEDLQNAKLEVYKSLGMQRGPLVIKNVTFVPNASGKFGATGTSTENRITIDEGIKVEEVSSLSIRDGSPLRAGDLKIYIPGNLINHIQLENAIVEYSDKDYKVMECIQKGTAIDGEVIEWLLIASKDV